MARALAESRVSALWILTPVETLPLFPELNAALVELLSSLSAEDWRRPTVHVARYVKDLASHLLDTALRRLAMQRDGWFASTPESSDWDGLVRFIQGMNRGWMDSTRPAQSPHSRRDDPPYR